MGIFASLRSVRGLRSLGGLRSLRMPPLVFAAFAAAVFVSPASCGTDDASTDSGKSEFTTKVYPQIQPTCETCHASGNRGAPIFLAGNAEGSYNAIKATPGLIAPPTESPLVQKGLHSGPALSDVQLKIVTAWLEKEPEGGVGDSTKPTNLRAAFKLFGQCMDYQEWQQLGLEKMGQSQSSAGACTACHNLGTASVWFSEDPAMTFEKLSQFPFVQRLVTGNVDDKGHFQRIVDAERLIVKGKEKPRNGNHHPAFDLGQGIQGVTPLEMQNNLRTFVSNTINKMYRINGCAGAVKADAGAD
jgi:hypothetical protein